MTLWAIVPVKPLRRGKSRLANILNEDERAELNQKLFQHTLETLHALREIEEVLVISRDPQVLTIARTYGARTVREAGQPELNTALQRATAVAKYYGTQGVLILPADLPLISHEDALELVSRAGEPPVVVIAPDRHNKGTNALLTSPLNLIDYRFGENSFQRHCNLVKQSGARLEVVNLPSLGLDLDMPEDLEIVRTMEGTLSY